MIHLVGEKQQRLFFREKYIQRGTMRNYHVIRVLCPFFLEAQMYPFPLVQSCCCLVTKSYLTLCDPMDGSPSGSSVHGISQQEHWSGLSYCTAGDRPDPGIEPAFPALAGGFFIPALPGKPCFLDISSCLF